MKDTPTERFYQIMNIRKLVAGVVTTLLLGGGLALATAAPASATTEGCVPIEAVEAWTETIPAVTTTVDHPAVYETVIVTPAVEYQPAVYEVEYEFRHKLFAWKTKWSSNPNWNAEDNEHSLGWYATGETRNGALISPEVPAQEAVTEQKLVTEAWTEIVVVTTEQIIEHPAVEGVTCPTPEESVDPPVDPVEPAEPVDVPEIEAILTPVGPAPVVMEKADRVDTLATTGSIQDNALPLAATMLVLLGASLLTARRVLSRR